MIKRDTSHYIDQSEITAYLYDVRKYTPLTREEEFELIKDIKKGIEKAKELLIYSNLRFVISVAKQYMNQGLDLPDLISEGNIGLIKAAERYNYDQTDVRFLSYAVWWIKQSIVQSLHDNARTIRLPVNRINDLHKLRKEAPKEYQETEPTDGDKKEVKAVHLPTVTQLDQPVDEEGSSYYDVIEDVNAKRPDVILDEERNELNLRLKVILSKLNESECYVITKYFGLDGDALTLQDISDDLELTRERVRQIKEKAIKKLRYHSTNLFEFI